jgi:DNA-binding beta-propeller fold protein YncE
VSFSGNAVIVADHGNNSVRNITPPQAHNHVSSLAGQTWDGWTHGHEDGEGTVALFNCPCGVAVDVGGNVLVADSYNNGIRKITPQGQVSTLAGNGVKGNRDGEATTAAQFNSPSGVAVDGYGNIIVADTDNHRICLITPQGQVSTLAGTGVKGHRDGEGSMALFHSPFGIAVDGDNNVIVADTENQCIRKITPKGKVSTMAGTGEKGHRDGEGSIAQFNSPSGVAVDGDGNIIVADTNNHLIRLVTSQGRVTTLAGTNAPRGDLRYKDGPGTAAQFNHPRCVAVDGGGNVIVADTDNHCIRCVSSDVVTPRGIVLNNHAVVPPVVDPILPPLLQSSFASDLLRHFLDADDSFHDACFVVEQERVPAHRGLLSARCKYFKSMFSAGFKEGDSAEIHIKDTTSVAFKALLKYLYTDNMEVDGAVLLDLAKLSDQYRVERLHNHCISQLFKGVTLQNAVMRLMQAHTASGEQGGAMWAKLKGTTMEYVTSNFKEIWCNAAATLELLDREHPELYKQILLIKCGIAE